MFGEWPAAAKWIAICTTALALLGTGTAAYFGWKSEIRQAAQLEMLSKALAKQLAQAHARRLTENEVAKLPPDRLLICNAAVPGTVEFDCCYPDRKCPALEPKR